MALDDVPRLDGIGQDHDLIPHGAARLLDLAHRPRPVPFARPERQARSVGAVEEVSALDPGRDLDLLRSPPTPSPWHTVYPPGVLRQAQQALDLSAVEAHHDLAADDSHGGGPIAEFLELIERSRIFADVLVRERNTLLRKKLFLGLAAYSARLAVDDDLFRHHVLLWAPSLRALSPKMSDVTNITLSTRNASPRCRFSAPACYRLHRGFVRTRGI